MPDEPIKAFVPADWYMGADGNAHPVHGGEAVWVTLLLHPDGTVTWETP